MITVTVYDNYQGDFSRHHWIYEVVNNSYNPSCFPFASNGFSGFLLYLDYVDIFEIDNIESPGPGWVIGAQYPLPINWDIVDADGIMPGQSGTFSFTTLPRYTGTMEGYFNTRCFGAPVRAVYFTTSDGPEGPGALKLPGACYINGSCQMMQKADCNSAGGQFCQTPKALLAAWPVTVGDATWMWIELVSAEIQLQNRGWSTERLPLNTPWTDVAYAINNDPCIRMLFMDAHGTDSHEIVFISNGTRLDKTPQQVASDIPNHSLNFLTVFLCYPSGWDQAFSNAHVSHTSTLIKGTTDATINWPDILRGHGVDMKTCTDSPQARFLAGPTGGPQRLSGLNRGGNECPSFRICDSSGCGDEIYPVYSCKDSIGVASAGSFSISSPDEMFEVAVRVPDDYIDSVLCAATYYEAVPDTLVHPVAIPLGRFLMFVDSEADSSVPADGLSVVMRYLESDLASAGIVDESKLGIYWVTSDNPEFQFVPSVLDTVENSLVFTVPQWGMAGIYEIDGATGVPGVRKPDDSTPWLGQNHPNPFNPSTTISFALPEKTKATLSIYDVQGTLVRTLVDEMVGEGYQERIWDGKDASGSQVGSGVYFYRLTAGDKTLTKKMVLLR